MDRDSDVIVIGAGFAGATAARECATRGLRTLILEGRDRVGGRTCTKTLSSGDRVDVGGTYVRWNQPHTWNEISRYALDHDVVAAAVPPEKVAIASAGQPVVEVARSVFRARSAEIFKMFTEHAREVFPNPAAPLTNLGAVEAIDQLTAQVRWDELAIPGVQDEWMYSFLAGMGGGVPADVAYSGILRWAALGEYEFENFDSSLQGFKLGHGTGSLLERILSDGGTEVRLNQVVTHIAEEPLGVRVTTADGAVLTSSTAVVAVPVNVWPYIEFSPALSEPWLKLALEGAQAPSGSKSVALIKGETNPMERYSEYGQLSTAKFLAPNEQIVTYWPAAEAVGNPGDTDACRAGILAQLPHVEVLDLVVETYMTDNPFCRGDWGFLKPGQLTTYRPHEMRNHGERLFFANSELANLWIGFIDGAIEAGLAAGRAAREQVRAELASATT